MPKTVPSTLKCLKYIQYDKSRIIGNYYINKKSQSELPLTFRSKNTTKDAHNTGLPSSYKQRGKQDQSYERGQERNVNCFKKAVETINSTKHIYLTPTTVLKSSSRDLLMYFWKLNLLPGAK